MYGASLVAQTVKRLPAMRETRVQSLGQEDPLEKEMATHSSILAWRIPWMEEPGRLQSTGSQSRTRLSDFTFFSLLPYVYVCTFSCVWLCGTPWTVACQTPLWDLPGKNTGVGCHFLLQGIFPTQESNPVSCISCIGRRILYQCAT